MSEQTPVKPKFGDRCNGCGYCCAEEVCEVGVRFVGAEAPCKLMRWREGRFFCGAVDIADSLGPLEGLMLRAKLAIGFGCDSQTDAEWDAANV
jgi:hypothetical protein